MESPNVLHRVIYGKPPGETTIDLLGYSAEHIIDDAKVWRSATDISPYPASSFDDSRAYGLFNVSDEQFVFVFSHNQDEDLDRPVFEYIQLNLQDLLDIAGNLDLLIDLTDEPIVSSSATHVPVDPRQFISMPTWTTDRRLIAVNKLFNDHGESIEHVLTLLGAILDNRGLVIKNYDASVEARLELIEGLMMLLPSVVRPLLTFTTHVSGLHSNRPRITFYDDLEAEEDAVTEADLLIFDRGNDVYPDMDELEHTAYIKCLEMAWMEGDTKSFLAELRTLELMSTHIHYANKEDTDIIAGLEQISGRYMQDMQVMNGVKIHPDNLKTVLRDRPPTSQELRERYTEQLLLHALETRDSEAALIVTNAMDADETLSKDMESHLSHAVEVQPDAVYFFVRERLRQGVSEKWLPQLHSAAVFSLQVAMKDGDTETLISWLRLIAREPSDYRLQDVLEQGLLAARERAHTDGKLGYQLILFSARRTPHILNDFLKDEILLSQLTEAAAAVLITPDAAILAELQHQEIFLVAVARALNSQASEAFSQEVVIRFWEIFRDVNTEPINLPKEYQPDILMHELVNQAWTLLPPDVVQSLLIHVLMDNRDDIFAALLHRAPDEHMGLIASTLYASKRPINDINAILMKGLTAEDLTPQQLVNISVQILNSYNWSDASLFLIDQVARTLHQHPNLTVPLNMLWQILSVCEKAENEQTGKIIVSQIMEQLEIEEDEANVVQLLAQLHSEIAWSNSLVDTMLNIWRNFVREKSLAQLQQLEKAFEQASHKTLEEAHVIVNTMIALRRVFGKRSLDEFAVSVGQAFRVLQVLSDAFDPTARNATGFDIDLMHNELDVRGDELTPDERQVLAKNLKELGDLIVQMSQIRSKATPRIRRGGDLDKGLNSGETSPQNAIDAIKWLSGYLEGAHVYKEED